MREILFRGKTAEGKWVYGYYVVLEGLKSTYHYILTGELTFGLSYEEHSVIPETVGQYTGLTDKNGTKIFEGDIVTTDIARPYLIVEFRDGCFMFNCNDGDKDYYDIMLPILDEQQTVYKHGEVIGNIHDNPELLGVE